MFALLLALHQAADIVISPLTGLSKVEKVTFGDGQKVTYTANARTAIQFSNYYSLSTTVTPDTTEKGSGFVILASGSVFEAVFQYGSEHTITFIISKIPDNVKKVTFIDGEYIDIRLSAPDFNGTDPLSLEPRAYINTKAITFNYKFINPLQIGEFRLYTDSFENAKVVIGNGISSGEIISTSGLVIVFVPNSNFGDFLKKNVITGLSYPGYYNYNLGKIFLSDKKNGNEGPSILISLPGVFDYYGLYRDSVTYPEFVEAYERMMLMMTWSHLTSDEYTSDVFQWRGISGKIDDGRTYTLKSASSFNMYSSALVSAWSSSYYYQYAFKSAAEYLDSSYGAQIKPQIEATFTAFEGFVKSFDVNSIIPDTIYGNVPFNFLIYSRSVQELSEKFPIGYDEQGSPIYINIPEMIDTMKDNIYFWLEVLGLKDINTEALLTKLHDSPNKVYIPDILNCLHIEFKYVLRILKVIDGLFSQVPTKYSTLLGSLPRDISPILSKIFSVVKEFIVSQKIELNSIDILINESPEIFKSVIQNYGYLVLDFMNCGLKFVKYVLTSTAGGDFNTRLNKFLAEKGQLLPVEIKDLLVAFSKSQCDLIEFVRQVNPNYPIDYVVSLVKSILSNEAAMNITKIALSGIPNTYDLINRGIMLLSESSTKLNDVITFFATLSNQDPQRLIDGIQQFLSMINDRTISFDTIFGGTGEYYYNYQVYTDFASFIRAVSTDIESKISEFKINYLFVEMLDTTKGLQSQTTIRGYIREILNILKIRFTSESIIDIFFSYIRFIGRRKDKILDYVPTELHPLIKPFITVISNINSNINNNDIEISSLLKCLFDNGDQLYSISHDFTTELCSSYNLTLALLKIPSSFIDIPSTLKKLQSLTVASFLNLYDCIVINKVEGKVTYFNVVPIDQIRNMFVNLFEIQSKRSLLLSDLSEHVIYFNKVMAITSYARSLWTDKLRPLKVLSFTTFIDFSQFFTSLLELTKSLTEKKFGPSALTSFVNSATEFIDKADQSGSDVPPAPSPTKGKNFTMFFIGGGVVVAILALFLVFKPKNKDFTTDATISNTLV